MPPHHFGFSISFQIDMHDSIKGPDPDEIVAAAHAVLEVLKTSP
jgi:hypothetical protein